MELPNCSLHALPFFLLTCSIFLPLTRASYTPFLTQSFFFNYGSPAQPVPIPITAQCETIHITWERSTATGPNPTPPYFLQIYTSTFILPFVVAAGSGLGFDWAVPFAPGTQYQVCMFDKNGNTGGCQAIYTVIPSTIEEPPTCQNVTFPLGSLDIEAVVANGPLSQFGWVEQCTDISISPKNGTPPYTITVAPALHSPYNITTNDMASMNWTVSLSWASPFFISVVDSLGNLWSHGPLHSGGGGRTACLALDDVSSETWVGPSVTVGAGVGGLVIGSLLGIASAYIFMKYRRRKELRGAFMHLSSASHLLTPVGGAPSNSSFSQYRPASSVAISGHAQDTSLASSNPSNNKNSSLLSDLSPGPSRYQIEPFVMPAKDGRVDTAPRKEYPTQDPRLLAPRETRINASSSSSSSTRGHIVRHDGGRAPLSVYHPDDTEIVELPPRYRGWRGAQRGSESEALLINHDERQDVLAHAA
ncbi:hypothetical protein FPV67DRAFT_1557604 [Lyophyllum atratum]|nr:hypothetical protein FPV67DRAFT_1557604 [Lyophyllum atratum]